MAFKIDDIIIDRIQVATAEDFSGNILYTLTQLSDSTLTISAESNDVTDRNGTLIKRFWRAKTGEFSAENALINLNIIGAMSGSGKVEASVAKPITAPGILIVKQDEVSVTLYNVTGTPKVYGLETNGTLGTEFPTGAGSETTFAFDSSTGVLTLPISNNYVQYIIRYNRTVTSGGVSIENKADKFPNTVRLVMKVLCVDPCSADTLRAAYLILPSFQVSPEVEINLGSDSQTITYSGQLQVDYCSSNQELYQLVMLEDDVEEED